jgi:hypothetical protein
LLKLTEPEDGSEVRFDKAGRQRMGLAVHPPEIARMARADTRVWDNIVGWIERGCKKGVKTADEPAMLPNSRCQ